MTFTGSGAGRVVLISLVMTFQTTYGGLHVIAPPRITNVLTQVMLVRNWRRLGSIFKVA